jgi:hypothetical protein
VCAVPINADINRYGAVTIQKSHFASGEAPIIVKNVLGVAQIPSAWYKTNISIRKTRVTSMHISFLQFLFVA